LGETAGACCVPSQITGVSGEFQSTPRECPTTYGRPIPGSNERPVAVTDWSILLDFKADRHRLESHEYYYHLDRKELQDNSFVIRINGSKYMLFIKPKEDISHPVYSTDADRRRTWPFSMATRKRADRRDLLVPFLAHASFPMNADRLVPGSFTSSLILIRLSTTVRP